MPTTHAGAVDRFEADLRDGDFISRETDLRINDTFDVPLVRSYTSWDWVHSNSVHAFALVSAGSGSSFIRRTSTGGTSASTPASTATPPRWVRLDRAGNTLTAYQSSDGSTWTQIGAATVTMQPTIWVGIAVTSHNNTTPTMATIDNVSVQ